MKSYNDYFYLGTTVLQNLRDIRDPRTLTREEAVLSELRARQPIGRMTMSPDGLAKVHHHLFQDVYPWAGKFRTVDMVKLVPSGKAVHFEKGAFVEPNMRRFFGELKEDLKSTDGFKEPSKKDFAWRAAVYLRDLNYIHPFVEGNGRMQRIFLSALALRSGFELRIRGMDKSDWIAASRESYQEPEMGPHRLMTALIERQSSTPARFLAQWTETGGAAANSPFLSFHPASRHRASVAVAS